MKAYCKVLARAKRQRKPCPTRWNQGPRSADADVVIVYQGSDDAPVANNDVAETNEDVAAACWQCISNDSDPDQA